MPVIFKCDRCGKKVRSTYEMYEGWYPQDFNMSTLEWYDDIVPNTKKYQCNVLCSTYGTGEEDCWDKFIKENNLINSSGAGFYKKKDKGMP
jgi:hypothetical protein